ncbi:MAG: deoxyribodipyrimidine photo-lyase [Oceanicoccus sp.]
MLKKSVFIFRRDLRLNDNSGLIAAMEASESVIPLFIVDPLLLSRWPNAVARLTFLAQALKNLDGALTKHKSRLLVIDGDPAEVIENLVANHSVDGVFINRDYTPLSRRRDRAIGDFCQQNGIQFSQHSDQLLNEPEWVSKPDGKPYTIFTPFFKKARQLQISAPRNFPRSNFETVNPNHSVSTSKLGKYVEENAERQSSSGSMQLEHIENLGDYDSSKDIPGIVGTTRLSAYLRFGLVSVREVYQTVFANHSASHGVIRQLYWRDFYVHIGYHFPHVYHAPFREKYRDLIWDDNPSGLHLWQQGKTGFPIVDAGMRELRATGYMHNRVRMITAAFLTKNLHIDWRLGEAHFGNFLIDYDPALNNGNWQWSASTGCDAQPYFRVFNPWRQQKRFDPDCQYIKRWIPELESFTAKEIHSLEKNDGRYLTQIVDLKLSAEQSKARFKAVAMKQSEQLFTG